MNVLNAEAQLLVKIKKVTGMAVATIDGKITPEFYLKKLEEYSKQKEEATDKLKKLNDGNTKYYQAGFALHELALRAGDIYKSPRATTEDKRLLLSKIFSNLYLNTDNITPNYTSAFQFLTKWIPILNKTFEPVVLGSTKAKEGTLMPSHPMLLDKWAKLGTFLCKITISMDQRY